MNVPAMSKLSSFFFGNKLTYKVGETDTAKVVDDFLAKRLIVEILADKLVFVSRGQPKIANITCLHIGALPI